MSESPENDNDALGWHFNLRGPGPFQMPVIDRITGLTKIEGADRVLIAALTPDGQVLQVPVTVRAARSLDRLLAALLAT